MRATIVGLALGSVACAPPAEQGTSGQDLSQESAFSVELFAPGVVSSTLPEFATTFTPSGDTVFFNRTTPDRSRIDLLFS
ncbi:MAG: hypothetical protein HKN73_07470, partial [Gemmatimonadetes bacterium]|nr:hypothetical protein [Gemmatimonadota bacterium]